MKQTQGDARGPVLPRILNGWEFELKYKPGWLVQPRFLRQSSGAGEAREAWVEEGATESGEVCKLTF